MNDVPAFHELMWPTITALRSLGGSATNEELLAKVISEMNLSPEVQAVQHSDGRQSKINYNLALPPGVRLEAWQSGSSVKVRDTYILG